MNTNFGITIPNKFINFASDPHCALDNTVF